MSESNQVETYARIRPAHTALLIIDMQRYFVRPEYPFGRWLFQSNETKARSYFDRVESTVIPNLRRIRERFRELNAQVAYTEFGSLSDDGRDMPGWARGHNEQGRSIVGSPVYPPFAHPSCRVDDALTPRSGELIVQKSTSGPVNSTKLDHTLHSLGIDTVVVTGVVTDVCVAQTAREFSDRDFRAIVIEDACAGLDDLRHQAALETIAVTFGTVVSTERALTLLEAPIA